MLLQIRDFILREESVSIERLCREFGIDSTALQPMLDIWVQKGVIKPCGQNKCQSACVGCNPKSSQLYQGIRLAEDRYG